jgi:LCP family protein required for cell wall assembly
VRAGGDGVPRPGRGALARSLLAAVVIAILTAGATATAALLKIDDYLPPPKPAEILPRAPVEQSKPGKPQTILLLGSDKRWRDKDDDPVRSDTMMLVRLNPRQKATMVLSIPRDLKVLIPGHGMAKINDAYALGGPNLAIETIRTLTGLTIHHVVNVNFKGFRSAINLFNCFYVDVDRRYFHSNVGVAPSARYDAIDIHPGYQKLCGNAALDYVRFRHADTDLVRAARQQDFLRAAKDQISTSRLIDDLKELGDITAKATQTDAGLRRKSGFLRVAKLALQAADLPVRQLDFPSTFTKEKVRDQEIDYVETDAVAVQSVVYDFLHGGGKEAKAPLKAGKRRGSVREANLVPARKPAIELVDAAGRRARTSSLGFQLRFPGYLPPTARYQGPDDEPLRIYSLRDRSGNLHRAYRLTIVHNRIDGQFYGVQGTTWRNPPLLAKPSAKRKIKGRTMELFRSGSRLRFVAWRTDRAAYWVSNTLNLKLSNAEMLAIAASLTTKKPSK